MIANVEISEDQEVRFCERCQREKLCELVPLMGYSLWMCAGCCAAAYRIGEAV